jgi:predicted aspartyl protease
MQLVHSWIIDEKLDAFFISIRVQSPTTRKSIMKWCLFDTGFTGYLGLDKATLDELGLKKVGTGDAMTITGKISFTTYAGTVEIMKDAIVTLKQVHANKNDGIVEENPTIPIQELKLPMVGMKLIQQFNWLIISEKKMLCLVDI